MRATKAFRDVSAERIRQIDEEGWTPEHDDREHTGGSLAQAGAAYAIGESYIEASSFESGEYLINGREIWPWSPEWWKPGERRRDLVKAAALIIAEIERIDRVDERG